MSYTVPENESKRLEALQRYQLLDTPAERLFDDIALLASYICGTPIALITLVDANRQWFKAKIGLETSETPREQAFCAHTILDDKIMIVEDAHKDQRFQLNPLVTAAPHIRFYAGAPLIDSEGFALGSICVIDREPRQLNAEQHNALAALARQVVAQFEFRRVSADLAASLADINTLRGLLPICTYCKSIRNDQGYWREVEEYIASRCDVMFSHGICPACIKLQFPELYDQLVSEGKI